MKASAKSRWLLVAFLSPLGAIAVGFGVGRGVADEELALRIVGIGGVCFLLLALAASICAFTRKEKLRWFTLAPILVILAMFTLGVSSSQEPNQALEPTPGGGRPPRAL
jgi:apolipoprotein N-acyltransferase